MTGTRARSALAMVAAALAGFAVAGEPARADPLPPERTGGVDLRDEANIIAGRQLFSGLCAGYCHGSAGTAKRGPALRNRPDLDEQTIYWIVMNGRKRSGNPMPPWKGLLEEDQVWRLAAYIVSLREAPPLE